ncbi:hypothetical protein G4B88_000994 [Cannabis sativa]|uniref:AP180 N-terminal homology (ANTH) domain-containing protein n=1 Tax=Cannabis sativa TaxID=3483 RepID=A0A7J6FDH6_CANSA|nr:hypothetical protein G4B88_000994 [Cannabis sativa]
MHPVVRESFQLYPDVCEVLVVLLDKSFDMEYPDCVNGFQQHSTPHREVLAHSKKEEKSQYLYFLKGNDARVMKVLTNNMLMK